MNEFDQLLRQVGVDLGSVVEAVKRTAFVEFQRAKLKAVDGIFRGALYLTALIAGLALAINAVVLLVSGLQGALAAATGNEWVSELLTGALIVAALLSAGWAVRSKLRSSLVRATQQRLGSVAAKNGRSHSLESIR